MAKKAARKAKVPQATDAISEVTETLVQAETLVPEPPPAPRPNGYKVERVALTELYEDPANPRTHNSRNLGAIMASLREFGQVEPLVVQASSGKVVGGNGRLRAMLDLGWTHAEVARLPLTDLQATNLGIALNRTAELADWDFQILGTLVTELQNQGTDLADLGWSVDDLSPILAAEWDKPAANGDLGEDFQRGEGSGDGDGPQGPRKMVQLTSEQTEVFERAAERVKAICDDSALTDGRCLELICADYLAKADAA